MKTKYLIFAIAFAIFCAGCSEKKEDLQKNQETRNFSEKSLNGNYLEIWKDSLKTVVIKNVVIPFVEKNCGAQDIKCKEKYNKDELFWLIKWKCKRVGCSSYIRNEKFAQDRTDLLDSLYRTNVLDSLVGLIRWSREKNEKSCFYQTQDGNKRECEPDPDLDLDIDAVLEDLKKMEGLTHDEIQAKFNEHAECVKSQNVDILKDSSRFKAVFDSCWQVEEL